MPKMESVTLSPTQIGFPLAEEVMVSSPKTRNTVSVVAKQRPVVVVRERVWKPILGAKRMVSNG